MKFPARLFKFLTRSPQAGDRKDPPMPEPTPTPAPASPAPAPDVSAQLGALSDALRQLAEAQKALLEAVKPKEAPPAPSAPSAPAPADVTGDPASGVSPSQLPADYSRLSPLQQITLGLRGAHGAD